MARKIFGCSRRDHRRNADILKELSLKQVIVQILRTRRLSYFGHVAQMNSYRYPHMLLHGHIGGTRPRGRPRKRWLDNIAEDCRSLHVSVSEADRLAQDRPLWRNRIWNREVGAAGAC